MYFVVAVVAQGMQDLSPSLRFVYPSGERHVRELLHLELVMHRVGPIEPPALGASGAFVVMVLHDVGTQAQPLFGLVEPVQLALAYELDDPLAERYVRGNSYRYHSPA